MTLSGMAALKAAVRGLTGWQVTNILSHPIGVVLGDLIDYFVDDEPKKRADNAYDMLFGYKQPLRQFTGPAVSDALDITSWMLNEAGTFSLAATMSGINDGSMPEYLATSLGLLGLKPSEEALTNHGRRQYSTAFDVLREHTLNAFSIKTRGIALINSVIERDSDDILKSVAALGGVRKDWDSVQKINKQRREAGYPDAKEIIANKAKVATERYFEN